MVQLESMINSESEDLPDLPIHSKKEQAENEEDEEEEDDDFDPNKSLSDNSEDEAEDYSVETD